MASLIEIASRARDLYNQDYPDRVEFFDMEDFKFHIAAKYSEQLNILYQVARKEGKMETGYSAVEIPSQWLISQKVAVDDVKFDTEKQVWYSITNQPVFSFDYDAFGNGLNDVLVVGGMCKVKKISNQEVKFYDILPTTPDVYFYIESSTRIEYLKKPPTPLIQKYIPAVIGSNDQCVMSDNIVPGLIMSTLQLMFGAKNGNVVPEANDGNSNEDKEQQINPALRKVQAQG